MTYQPDGPLDPCTAWRYIGWLYSEGRLGWLEALEALVNAAPPGPGPMRNPVNAGLLLAKLDKANELYGDPPADRAVV